MISIVGTGPGNSRFITEEGRRIINDSDILVGARRHLDEFRTAQTVYELNGKLSDAVEFIKMNTNSRIVVLASGEPKLYGIAAYLGKHFKVNVISGISSVQYLFSKIKLDMNDVYITSAHGKMPDYDVIGNHGKTAMVTDKKTGPVQIAKALIEKGFDKRVIVGENLSYVNEKIQYFDKLEDVTSYGGFDMNVVILYDREK